MTETTDRPIQDYRCDKCGHKHPEAMVGCVCDECWDGPPGFGVVLPNHVPPNTWRNLYHEIMEDEEEVSDGQ